MKHKKSATERNPFRDLSKWFFLVGFVIFAAVAVFALRNNNLTAIKLRDEVVRIDQQQGDVEAALRELREFVYSHMNADLSTGGGIDQPIQLKYRYERLVEQEKERIQKANEAIYPKAQKYCEKQLPTGFSGRTRISCIEEYVLNNGEKEQEISGDLYKFSFVSPRWSPDLAGWSIVLSSIFLIIFVTKFGLDLLIKYEFKD